MSERATITETCGCGATFSVTAWSVAASSAATAWRKQHMCSPPTPPGPCWHDSGVRIGGERLPEDNTYRCKFLAGHRGAHQCTRRNGEAVWPNDLTPARRETETDPTPEEHENG